jgi:hypothetical protein
MPAPKAASRLANMAADARAQDGQMLPLVILVLAGIVGFGMLVAYLGKAAVMRSDAQTAADAAALAAVKNVQAQLSEQVARTGTSSFTLIDDARVKAAAEDYAQRNGGHLARDPERHGADIRVWVETDRTRGEHAPDGHADDRGEARARARVQLAPLFTSPSGGNVPLPSGGDPKISDDEWKDLKGKLKHHPPQCSSKQGESDLYQLGLLLKQHGFLTGENAQLGDQPSHSVGHSETGWHFKCGDSGAIDLNWPGTQAQENDVIDPLVKPLQDLGFRTIWRVPPDHTDHMHIDTGNGPPLGPGGVANPGAAGPLQDSFLEVQLIDWDAPEITGYAAGFLGGRGGIPFGPPDPAVAELACQLLHKYDVSGRARLALWEALIQESGVHNLPYGDSTSVGVLQALDIHGSFERRMNAEWQMTVFLLQGWAGPPGAIGYARQNPGATPGQIAQHVQQSADGSLYDPHLSQAVALNSQFCGGEGL